MAVRRPCGTPLLDSGQKARSAVSGVTAGGVVTGRHSLALPGSADEGAALRASQAVLGTILKDRTTRR